jgi:hypothetical protein
MHITYLNQCLSCCETFILEKVMRDLLEGGSDTQCIQTENVVDEDDDVLHSNTSSKTIYNIF